MDLARALAIVGMFAIHVGPTDAGGLAGRLYAAPHGRASILFGFVAGVGVAMLARSRTASAGQARARLLWRAVVLLPLGLALQLLDHGVYVILQDYALLFLVAVPLLGLRDRWLLGLSALALVGGPLLYLWYAITGPHGFTRDVVAFGQPAGDILRGLVLSGPYPLVTWVSPFLFGMWLGRRDLAAARVRRRLMGAGALVTVAAAGGSALLVAATGTPAPHPGWDQLVLHDPHSQMPLWLLGATGTAAFVLGAALTVEAAARRLAWPLVAAGQLALTVYVGHLLALHAAPDALHSAEVGTAALIVLGFTLAAAALATAWRARYARGPLEATLHLPWTLAGPRRPTVPVR